MNIDEPIYFLIAVLSTTILFRIIIKALQAMNTERRRKKAHHEYKNMPRPQLTVVKGEKNNNNA